MDPTRKKGQGRQGSNNRSSRRPDSNFKLGSRNIDVSNDNHQVASKIRSGNDDQTSVEGTGKTILFQLGSIASYGVSNTSHPKKDPKKVIDGKKISLTSPLPSSSTPSDEILEINAKDENNKHSKPVLFGVSSRSDTVQESQVPSVTHTRSPPVQVMDRGGYDPKRIPSSVFSRTRAMDWSEASNDSLFSLHLGASSLARDPAFQSSEMPKSGELPKSGEFISFSPSLPNQAGDCGAKITDTGEKKSVGRDITSMRTDNEEKSPNPVASWSTPCTSNISDLTPASMQSFSSPIMKKNKKKKKKKNNKKTKTKKKKIRCCGFAWLMNCFRCSDNCCTNSWSCFSCCRWPKCSCCHSSSCSCCSWLFCCRWCSCCSSSSAELTDEETRREYKEQKLQATEQPKAKSSLYHKWFCCFPPCLWSCPCRSCSCSCPCRSCSCSFPCRSCSCSCCCC